MFIGVTSGSLLGRNRKAAMRETFANIGISIASNTALFTGLDVGQWIADKFSLGALLANLFAALIATAFPLALAIASRMFSQNSAGMGAALAKHLGEVRPMAHQPA